MKKNMLQTMERLEIDEGIRGLIRQMWKHCYKTRFSCEGGWNLNPKTGHYHSPEKYVTYLEGSGDGWFEKNASKYGLYKDKNKPCCDYNKQFPELNFCECGAGINGNVAYSDNCGVALMRKNKA